MDFIQKTVTVDAAIWRVFGLWRRLENFPKFIESVQEVRWLEPGRLFWREQDPDGSERASILKVQFDLNRCQITWQNVSEADNEGQIQFEPLPGSKTRLTMQKRYLTAAGAQESPLMAQRLEGYLKDFKKFVESKGAGHKQTANLSAVVQPVAAGAESIRKW